MPYAGEIRRSRRGLCPPLPAEAREAACRSRLRAYLEDGVERELLTPVLLKRFDLERLAGALRPARNAGFTYLSLQTLYDRYLIKIKSGRRIELPKEKNFFETRVTEYQQASALSWD